jgi:hypothetical protein
MCSFFFYRFVKILFRIDSIGCREYVIQYDVSVAVNVEC